MAAEAGHDADPDLLSTDERRNVRERLVNAEEVLASVRLGVRFAPGRKVSRFALSQDLVSVIADLEKLRDYLKNGASG